MDYTYGNKHHVGNVEFGVYDDGSLEIEASGVHASLGGISLSDAPATATIVQPWGGEEAKKARAEIIAALRELASDLENPRERITNVQSCHYWGDPLDEGEPFVEGKTGERYHVGCALEFVFHYDLKNKDNEEAAYLLTQLEEKFSTELEAHEAHEAALVESRKQNRQTPADVGDV
jgi:hypothetical protein